jgi:predicted RNA-binding Zn ribbon-like protein
VSSKQPTAATIQLLGGTLCLDFVNTTEWGEPGARLPKAFDVLADPESLVTWGRRLGVLRNRGEIAVADHDVDAALALRSLVHTTFSSVAAGDDPPLDALEQLHALYAEGTATASIRQRDEGWRLTWPDDKLGSLRFAVAADAIALLGDAERLSRLRQCPGRNCGGLFIDTSGRRRWCSMDGCGSRAKMRRHYARQRGQIV